MSDREKAPTMSGEYDSLNLWNDGNATLLVRNVFETTFFINPTPDSDKVDVTARIKRKYLPFLLSGLTLEDVEKAIYHVIAYEGVPPHVPVEKFVGLIVEQSSPAGKR